MIRSPFFILVLLTLVSSCKKEPIPGKPDSNPNSTIAFVLRDKAISFYGSERYDSAFFYFDKSKTLFELDKDSANIGYCLYKMAETQQVYGDYTGSEETITELLSYQLKDYDAAAYNLLGVISKELGNYDDAIERYAKSGELAKTEADRQSPQNNIAAVYIEQEKYAKARLVLEDILKSGLLDTQAYQNRKARVIDNLGFACFKENENQTGLRLMNEALATRIKNGDAYGSIESYLHLSEYYKDKDFGQFLENANHAYEAATAVNSVDERLEALQLLMSYNKEKGKNRYALRFNSLNDSIRKVRNNAKNQFAKIKYDSKEAKEKQADAELKLERQINKGNYYIIGILCLIGILGFVFTYYRNKNRRERTEAVYKTETRISKQLHDELANDVFHAMTFAESQDLQNPVKKEALLDNLDKIYSRTRNISTENSTIDTGEMFEIYLIEMLNSYKTGERQVIIKTNNPVNWAKVTNEKKIAVYRVLQELMVNMKKYSQATFVIIGFDMDSHLIMIEYTDNGIGILKDQIRKSGLQNVENRIDAIDGTFTFETINKGCKIKITFPK
jgi:two-component sensor histidine kinase